MRSLLEKARRTPIAGEFDVCVVGGSCTGVFAAVRAAQLGARVALVEKNGFFGGVATAGLVNIWHSLYDTVGRRKIISGLTEETINRLVNRNAAKLIGMQKASSHTRLNTAELIIELDELIRAHPRIRPFLHAAFAAPVMDDIGRVSHVIIEDKSGRRAIKAAYFIDATGDGDLVARAGLPTWREQVLQPPTTGAILFGLDEVAARNPGFEFQQVFNPKYKGGFAHCFQWSSEFVGLPGASFFAASRVNDADCSDADQLTAAEMEGRRQIRSMCDIIRKNFKDGDKLTLAALPASIGIRESRKCVCLHRLTEQELLSGKRFDDAIANGSYCVDIHHSDSPGITFRYLNGTESRMTVGPNRKPVWETGRWREKLKRDPTFYQIPYRCLVPKGSRNVLCAGRLLDADKGAYGAVRVMVNCNQTGEAAGCACALALKSDTDVPDVDTSRLRKTLTRLGAVIV